MRYVMFMAFSMYSILGPGYNYAAPIYFLTYLHPKKELLLMSLMAGVKFHFGFPVLAGHLAFYLTVYCISNMDELKKDIEMMDKVYKTRDNSVFLTNMYNGVSAWIDLLLTIRCAIVGTFDKYLFNRLYSAYGKLDKIMMDRLIKSSGESSGSSGSSISSISPLGDVFKFSDDVNKYRKVMSDLDELMDDKSMDDMKEDIERMEKMLIKFIRPKTG